MDARTFAARCLSILAVLFTCAVGPSDSAPLVPPRIEYPDAEDANGNLIVDRLEAETARLSAAGKPEAPVRLEVVLYEPYTEADLALFRNLGGTVIHTFEAVSYGFSGTFPAGRVGELLSALNQGGRVCVISDDPTGHGHLDYSARHVRARSLEVWGAGYDGDSTTTIAILDTGIDDAHTDFSGRVSAGWTDTTSEAYGEKVDYNGHGSHVSGIALGSGAVYGSGAVATVTLTKSGRLPTIAGNGYFDYVEVKSTGVSGLQLNLAWAAGTAGINCRNTAWSWMGYSSSGSSPFLKNYNITTAGVHRPIFVNHTGAGNAAYSALETFNYSSVGDGYNLFRGMAPACTLLGVKVLRNDISGSSTDWGEGLDWCVERRDTYNIRVINLSLGIDDGGTNGTLDTKVNNAVANGIVVVCSAGNDYPTYTIPSPGNAAKAITVGAINDDGAMTNYSSNGFSGQNKPDVVAPGGSRVAGTPVTSVETNDGDAQNALEDRNSDDYWQNWGTSMASPMVAGLAGLLIDAQVQTGDPWNSTQAEALRVKSIILMTATEINKIGEKNWNGGNAPVTDSGNNPTLNRGARDLVEGFGKINADAAIEAMTTTQAPFTGEFAGTFGAGQLARKAAARKVVLESGTAYDFTLRALSGSLDGDLYIYDGTPDGNGNPVIRASATNASLGTDETITNWTAPSSGTYYMVGKYVSGAGTGNYGFEFGPREEPTATPTGTASATPTVTPTQPPPPTATPTGTASATPTPTLPPGISTGVEELLWRSLPW